MFLRGAWNRSLFSILLLCQRFYWTFFFVPPFITSLQVRNTGGELASNLYIHFILFGLVRMLLSLDYCSHNTVMTCRNSKDSGQGLSPLSPPPSPWRHCTYPHHAVHYAAIVCLSYSRFKPGLYFKCFTNKTIITQYVSLFQQFFTQD